MALLVAFLVIEAGRKEPVLPLSIFRLRTLAGANAAGLLLGGSFFAFIFVGTLYMQQVLHYSALQTGLAWLAASLTSIALAGVSQALVTRGGAKVVMAIGMTLIGAGVLWATQVPVHGHFLANLAGPFVVAGAGTAFAFIPISIAALAGVSEHQAGLASGLLNTSQQLGGAIGIAIASSVAASHTQTLLHAGTAAPAALTGGFQQALWVLGAIALLAVPAIFALVRRDELSDAVAKTTIREPQPALAGTQLTQPTTTHLTDDHRERPSVRDQPADQPYENLRAVSRRPAAPCPARNGRKASVSPRVAADLPVASSTTRRCRLGSAQIRRRRLPCSPRKARPAICASLARRCIKAGRWLCFTPATRTRAHPRRARVGTSQVPRRQLGWWSQLAMRVVSA